MRYLAFLAVFLLAGCGYFSKNTPDFSCPATGYLKNADRVTFLQPNVKKKDPGFMARFEGFHGDCSFKTKGVVEETLVLPFSVRKGAAAGDVKEKKLSYFISVLSPDEEVLQRQSFTTTVTLDPSGAGRAEEEHTIRIPLDDASQAWRYKVVFGLELTPEQLTYNKEH